jgi:predicted N-acetyltransferase YhbS
MLEFAWLDEPDPDAATLVSRAFLASPVFAGIDESRYSPEAILRSMGKGRTLTCRDQGELVGSITLYPVDPESPCGTFRDYPSFGLVAVHPDWTRQGIALALIADIEEQAGPGLALSVTQRGEDLIAFYRRLGYREVETFHWPGAIDPSLIMLKRMPPY